MGRILTLTGRVLGGDNDRIMFFDSIPVSKGWRILSLEGNSTNVGGFMTHAILHSDANYNPTGYDPEDNRTIGVVATSKENGQVTLVDYNHVIVSDLFIKNGLGSIPFNYLVTLEEMDITPTENIIYRIKERAQDF